MKTSKVQSSKATLPGKVKRLSAEAVREAEYQAWVASHKEWVVECSTPPPEAAVPVRITGWHELGAAITVLCPYCGQEHQHTATPINLDFGDGPPLELLMGPCLRGCYLVSLTPAK